VHVAVASRSGRRGGGSTGNRQCHNRIRHTDSSISVLSKRLSRVEEAESSTEKRRACKSVIRGAQSLLEKYPGAPNRFGVLATAFESRQILFSLDDSEQNRVALFETCRVLAEAPDEHAEIRLPADVLLTQVKLVRRGVSTNEAAEAITQLVSRYEDTPAEAESLIMASMIAMDVGDGELLKTLLATLSERFAEVPSVRRSCENVSARPNETSRSGAASRAATVAC